LKYPIALTGLIQAFARLPGVGPRSAQRLALALALDRNLSLGLENALAEVREKVGVCKVCGSLAEGDLCTVCGDETRDRSIIAVVESPADVFAIEKSGEFQGLYHVLGGVLNPLEGIGPEDLNIQGLLDRLDGVREVLLATPMTVEGEATATYLYEILKDRGVVVTRLAYGVPAGGSLEYVDEVTLGKALSNRRPVGE